MAEDIQQEFLMQCGHCDNKTLLRTRAAYRNLLPPERPGDENAPFSATATWYILECPVCHYPTFYETYRNPDIKAYSHQVLYPISRKVLDSLPDAVNKAYLAALKVKNIEPNACAVLVGRTLEVVCKHEGAKGKVLADKIKSLANSGRIPQELAQMAEHIKQLRNLGAHADTEDEVKPEDIPFILDFLEVILEYLYVIPSKLAKVENRISRKGQKWQLKPFGMHDMEEVKDPKQIEWLKQVMDEPVNYE